MCTGAAAKLRMRRKTLKLLRNLTNAVRGLVYRGTMPGNLLETRRVTWVGYARSASSHVH